MTNLLSEIWIPECRQMSTLMALSLLRGRPAQNLLLPPPAFTSPKQPTLFPQNKSGQRELHLGNTNMVKVCFVFPTLYFKFLFRNHQQTENLVIVSKLRWVEIKLYLIWGQKKNTNCKQGLSFFTPQLLSILLIHLANNFWVLRSGLGLKEVWKWITLILSLGLPRGFNGKESAFQCRRHGFAPWVWTIHWRRKWQPTPVWEWEIL